MCSLTYYNKNHWIDGKARMTTRKRNSSLSDKVWISCTDVRFEENVTTNNKFRVCCQTWMKFFGNYLATSTPSILVKQSILSQSGLHTSMKWGRKRPIERLPISVIKRVDMAPSEYRRDPLRVFSIHLVWRILNSLSATQHWRFIYSSARITTINAVPAP